MAGTSAARQTGELPVCCLCGWIHQPDDAEACMGPVPSDELEALELDDPYQEGVPDE